MEEIWKDIPGYEGIHQISNKGVVKSLERWVPNNNGKTLLRERILSPYQTRSGYLRVGLSLNRKVKQFLVHKLVAKAFIPNPKNYPQINHKDENPLNNSVENLEWCDEVYNCNYGTRNSRIGKANLNRIDCSKKVGQYDKLMNLLAVFPSMSEAERQTGIPHNRICMTCKGQYKSAGGYIWKYI